jgi:hypothetical protein
MVQSPLDLAALASHEEVDAIMLLCQNIEEGIAECALGAFALAWDRYGLVRAGRSLVLYEVFEVVVVDVICGRTCVSGGLSGPRRNVRAGTHNGPILVWTSV